MQSKTDLGRTLVRTLRSLRNATSDTARTDLLRDIAQLSVDLREHFLTPQGEPDWAARTWAYREYLRACYAEAGYTPDEARTTQAAVRYHVSRYLRERLSDEELRHLGLRPEATVDRARERRAAKRALFEAATSPHVTGDMDGAEVKMIASSLLLLQRVDPARLYALGDRERDTVRVILTQLARRVDVLATYVAGAAEAGRDEGIAGDEAGEDVRE